MFHTKGEELGALNRRFRLQDLTLPEARQIDGPGVFVKTTIAPQMRTSDARYSATPGPAEIPENVDRGFGFFSLCMDDTPL